MNVVGFLDVVTPSNVSGWAFDRDQAIPLKLELFINDKPVASTIAARPRPDLVVHGIHATGNCGYRFELDALGISLPEYSKTEVKISGCDTSSIFNSPYQYYRTSYLDQLALELKNRKPNPNNTIVVGLAKSGTSLLAHKIKQGINAHELYFEPFGRQGLYHVNFHLDATKHDKIVTKSLFYPNYSTQLALCGACYGKKILVVRDPRDLLISSFFYSWNAADQPPIDKFEDALQLVKKKEQTPQNIPFLSLMETRPEVLLEWREGTHAFAKQIEALGRDWFVLKYEDISSGNLHSLESYLGFKIPDNLQQSSQKKISRLQRSSKSEQWRRWLTQEDVRILKNELKEVMQAFAYSLDDWILEPNEIIPSSEGSEYMQNIFGKSRS